MCDQRIVAGAAEVLWAYAHQQFQAAHVAWEQALTEVRRREREGDDADARWAAVLRAVHAWERVRVWGDFLYGPGPEHPTRPP